VFVGVEVKDNRSRQPHGPENSTQHGLQQIIPSITSLTRPRPSPSDQRRRGSSRRRVWPLSSIWGSGGSFSFFFFFSLPKTCSLSLGASRPHFPSGRPAVSYVRRDGGGRRGATRMCFHRRDERTRVRGGRGPGLMWIWF